MISHKEKTRRCVRVNTRNFFLTLKVLLEEQKQLEIEALKLEKIIKKRKSLRKNTLKLNKRLLGMQRQLSGAVSKTLSKTLLKMDERKEYVSRCDNKYDLLNSIHRSMKPNKKMKMDNILNSLKEMGYKTNSKDKLFYTMVNNKLHKDHKSNNENKVTKLRRGIFVYKYRSSIKPEKRNNRKRQVLQSSVS